MGGTTTISRVVDVVGIDAHQRRARVCQILGRAGGHKRMCSVAIFFSSPICVPAGVEKYSLTSHVQVLKRCRHDRAFRAADAAHYDAFQTSEGAQVQAGKILAVGIAMEGSVEVSAGVGHHFDFTDVKLGSLLIKAAGCFAAKMV